MFGVVCSGRQLQMASQVAENKFIITIPNASNISHLAIFLLPNSEFNINYTALIFFQLPNSQDFKLLGGLNANKPSGIYKLNNNVKSNNEDMIMEDDIDTNDNYTINIGLSIEPTADAELQLNQEKLKQSGQSTALVRPAKQPVNVNDTATLANKIVGHAYNYLTSFIDGNGMVPIKAFDTWWEKFKGKLNNNPNFLNELDA